MRPTYADATAANCGEARYIEGMRWLAHMNMGNNQVCLKGMSTLDRQLVDTSQQVVKTIDRQADTVFEGWTGHVTVGSLQQVGSP